MEVVGLGMEAGSGENGCEEPKHESSAFHNVFRHLRLHKFTPAYCTQAQLLEFRFHSHCRLMILRIAGR